MNQHFGVILKFLVAAFALAPETAMENLVLADTAKETAMLQVLPKIVGRELEITFHNRATQPLRLWRAQCSWGWHNLSIEIIDPSTKKSCKVRRKERGWTRNGPAVDTLMPGHSQALVVRLTGDSEWQMEVVPSEWATSRLEIRAHYSVEETTESKNLGVWTGRIASPPAMSSPPHDWLPISTQAAQGPERIEISAQEALAHGHPALGFSVVCPRLLRPALFPVSGSLASFGGPPGGTCLIEVSSRKPPILDAEGLAVWVRQAFAARLPLIEGAPGKVMIGGQLRPAYSFETGAKMAHASWCAVSVAPKTPKTEVPSEHQASLLLAFGLGGKHDCNQIMADPNFASFAHSFELRELEGT